ncbi:MAG: hypothetical protein IJ071_08780 [Ruminococcus sp.]|nr:hypothetical protein [Ruminococcus sp.]
MGKLLNKNKESDDQKELRLYEECRANEAPQTDGSACFIADDAFPIAGRGVVVAGVVAEGTFSVGDKVMLDDLSGELRETQILRLETFRKVRTSVSEGEEAGMLLKGLQRKDIKQGDLIIK